MHGKEGGAKTMGTEYQHSVGLVPALNYGEVEERAGHLVGPQGEVWNRKKIFHWTRMPKKKIVK